MSRTLHLCLALQLTVPGAAAAETTKTFQRPPAGATTVLWEAPKPMTAADWTWGPGGQDHAPAPPFQFVKEDLSGTNPKVEVKDAKGTTWTVKFGPEVHGDTFAPRLVYAAGYIVVPTYFVASGTIAGTDHLKRAKRFLRDGAFRDARFKLHDKGTLAREDKYDWSWKDNPFSGSHELAGLKVLMMLTSNWDGKDASDNTSNTGVFLRKADSGYAYVFTDWGATMGKWGNFFQRGKWDSRGYARQTRKLVKSVSANGEITWGYSSGKHKRDITQGIQISDVRWLVPWLARITDQDLHAGLMASGALPENVETFTSAIRGRIRELQEVAGDRQNPAQSK